MSNEGYRVLNLPGTLRSTLISITIFNSHVLTLWYRQFHIKKESTKVQRGEIICSKI